MPLRKAEGIVLRNRNLGEADKIITVFTREYGKIQFVAKGVRKAKSKLVGGTTLFAYGQYFYYQRTEHKLGVLCQYALKESFRELREDLPKIAYAAYLVELVDEMLPEDEANERVFVLLLTTMHLLKTQDPVLLLRIFELRLLAILGLVPRLDRCAECGAVIGDEAELRFSARLGGIVCENCMQADPFAMRFSGETRKLMELFLRINLQKLTSVRVSPLARQEMEKLLRVYLNFQLEKRLKSVDFMHTISQMNKEGGITDGNDAGKD